MFLNQFFQFLYIVFVGQFLGKYHFFVGSCIQIIVLIQHICDTAAHTCCEVLSCFSDNNHAAAGHVLTSVITDTFNYCDGTGVSHGKTLTCHTVDKCFSAGCSIKRYVTDDNVFILTVFDSLRRIYHQFSTRKSFSEVIVAVAFQLQCQTVRDKGSEALSTGSVTLYNVSIIFQSVFVSSCDLRTENRTKGTVDVGNINLNASFLLLLQCGFHLFHQHFLISCFLQFEIVYFLRIKDNFILRACKRILQNVLQIQFCSVTG